MGLGKRLLSLERLLRQAIPLEQTFLENVRVYRKRFSKAHDPDQVAKLDYDLDQRDAAFKLVLEMLLRQKPHPSVNYHVLNQPENPFKFETPVLLRFKQLLQMFHEIERTKGVPENVERLRNFITRFPPEDQALYNSAVEYLTIPENYSSFYEWYGKAKHELEQINFYHVFNLTDHIAYRKDVERIYREEKDHRRRDKLLFKLWINEFMPEYDPEFYGAARGYVESVLIEGIDSKNLSDELWKLDEDLLNEGEALRRLDIPDKGLYTLKVSLNPRSMNMLVNNSVHCCITDGKAQDASVLYLIDPAVQLWNTVADGKGWPESESPFGFAIFVATNGYSISTKKRSKYLVLEGFPANDTYYKRIGELREFARRDLNWVCLPYEGFNFPQLIYFLGLATARLLGIPKLFINTEHSGRQKSVEGVVKQAAKEAHLPAGVWEMSKHDQFRLLKDPLTNDSFAHITVKDQCFEYTHFLQKPQFPPRIIENLKIQSLKGWRGEGYFDTWYKWNEFIMDTYKNWSPELKEKHPYAEALWRRGKEPCWNLGIGYCKGFEVEVDKEYERLRETLHFGRLFELSSQKSNEH